MPKKDSHISRSATRLLNISNGQKAALGAAVHIKKNIEALKRQNQSPAPKYKRYYLNYVIEGQGEYLHPNGSIKIGPGTVFHRLPDRFIPIRWYEKPNHECFLWLEKKGFDLIKPFNIVDQKCDILYLGNDLYLQSLFSDLQNKIQDRELWQDGEAWASLINVLAYVFNKSVIKENNGSDFLHKAQKFLSPNHSKNITLDEIAKILNLSVSNFRKKFYELTGISPNEYRIRRRIETACSLLVRYSIKDTAYRLGYPDSKSFLKQFKKYTTMTPSEFLDHNSK